MRPMRIAAAAILAFVATAAAPGARAERLEAWAVVGLRAGDPSGALRDEVADLRGALLLELSARGGGTVLDEEASRLRLGIAGDLRVAREALEAAELYYFQLDLAAARANLERALDALAWGSGIPDAWEKTRDARMLLAMVHLASDAPERRERALRQLEAVVRVDSDWTPAASAWPDEILALHDEARARLAAGGTGNLTVRCVRGCGGGTVFVDGRPLGAPDAPLALPAGRYRVVLADRAERPDRTSLAREVDVVAGQDVVFAIDLEAEGRLRLEEGPVVLAASDERRWRDAASLVARRAATEFTLVLLEAAPEAGRRAWLLDATGAIRADLSVDAAAEAPLRELARRALAAKPAPAAPEAIVAALLAPPAERDSNTAASAATEAAPAPAERPIAWQAAKWGAAGGAVLAAALGLGLHVDAADRDATLRSRLGSWNGVVPTSNAARAVRSEADAIAAEANWGTGLLVGAGFLAATAATLFLLEPEAPAPAVQW